jgi:hypothetical protein
VIALILCYINRSGQTSIIARRDISSLTHSHSLALSPSICRHLRTATRLVSLRFVSFYAVVVDSPRVFFLRLRANRKYYKICDVFLFYYHFRVLITACPAHRSLARETRFDDILLLFLLCLFFSNFFFFVNYCIDVASCNAATPTPHNMYFIDLRVIY